MNNLIIFLMAQVISSNTLLETPTAYFPKSPSFWEGGFITSFALRNLEEEFEPHPFDFDLFVQGAFGGKYFLGAKIYTLREIGLDFSYKIMDEIGNIPAISIGIRNITYKKYINPAGGEPPEGGFKDENYEHRNPEVASFYLVSTKKMGERFVINAGIGRGEFIGYGPRSKYLNVDIFSKDYHDYTLGIFGGIKFYITKFLSAVLEADGRDFNFGIRFEREMFQFTIQTNKLEHIFWGSSTYPLSPRLTASLSINSGIIPEKPVPVYVKFEIYDKEMKIPIKGVKVVFLETKIPPIYTNEKGIAGYEVMPGKYSVEIEKEGYKKLKAQLNVTKEKATLEARIYLTPLVLKKEIVERYIVNAREYAKRENYVEAKKNYENALNTLPDYPGLKEEYENFITLWKGKIETHRSRAISYEAAGDYQKAIASWQEVLRIDPENKEADEKIKELTEKIAKPKVERKPPEKKIEKPAYTKEDIEKMLNQAISEYNNKNYRKAKEILQKVLAIDPNNSKAKEYMEKTEKRLKLLEK
ncbi:MAG: tetratricopeptide repeat protein [candidate division WOR-3 bacterium]